MLTRSKARKELTNAIVNNIDNIINNSETTISENNINIIQNEIQPLYEVNIDFDDASKQWHANKKFVGNGMYKYICPKITKKGNVCGKKCLPWLDCCKIHNYKI
jgi:hypothetical protein